jgi:hypothetical protein
VLKKSQYGSSTWIDVLVAGDVGFTIQITPNDGVGVSRLPREDSLDLGGHDWEFVDLREVLDYIELEALE